MSPVSKIGFRISEHQNPAEHVRKKLVMRRSNKAAAEKLPMVRLWNELPDVRLWNPFPYATKVSDDRGVPIFSKNSHPFLNATAAPEHYFTGIISDVLFLCFRELGSKKEGKDLKFNLVHDATLNGSPVEDKEI